MDRTQTIRSLLFVAVLTTAGLTTLAAFYFGLPVAIKGSYALFGLAAAFALCSVARGGPSVVDPLPTVPDQTLVKTFFVAYASLIAAATVSGSRVVPLLVGLPVCYALVTLQIAGSREPSAIVPAQAGLLLVSSALVKYLHAGLYFGNADVLRHLRYTERLVEVGRVAAIEGPLYRSFPGLHVLVGSTSLVSGLPLYDALYLSGVVAFLLVPPIAFQLVRLLTGNGQLAALVSVSTSFAFHLQFYASYFFPQSLAFVLLVVGIYLLYRVELFPASRRRAHAVVVSTIGLAAVVTHHLTFLLFAPAIAVLLLSTAVLRRLPEGREAAVYPNVTLLSVILAAEFIYLSLFGRPFLVALLVVAVPALLGSGVGGTRVAKTNYGFGVENSPETVASSLAWLIGPHGTYFAILVATFAIGAIYVLVDRGRRRRALPVYLTGVVGALVVPKTPIPLKSVFRIGLPWAFFFAVVVGFGLFLLLGGRTRSMRTLYVGLAFVVVLGSFAPMVPGGDFYEQYPRPTPQTSFSEGEDERLAATADFVGTYGTTTSAVWLERWALYRLGVDARWATVRDGALTYRTTLVYRYRWIEHRVNVETGTNYLDTFLMSRGYLDRSVRRSNKIYTTGRSDDGVGVVWTEGTGSFEPSR